MQKNLKGKARFKAIDKEIKKVVKAQLDRRIEEKVVMNDMVDYNSGNNNLILQTTATVTPFLLDLTPIIVQGDGLQQRAGTKTRIRKAYLDLLFVLNGAAITADVDVPLNVYYNILKNRSDSAAFGLAESDIMFYYESGTIGFLSGSGYAANHVHNNDYFKYYKSNMKNPIKLGWSQYNTTGIGNNNDFKSNVRKRIDITSIYDKVCHFSNASSLCTNNQRWMTIHIQKITLNTTTLNWDPPACFPTLTIEFEDA